MMILKNESELNYNEHAVIVYFNYGINDDDPYHQLGMELEKIMRVQRLGFYDGHEIAMDNSGGSYYLYGPDAEAIFKAIKPTLEATGFMKGATALLCFGANKDDPRLELTLE